VKNANAVRDAVWASETIPLTWGCAGLYDKSMDHLSVTLLVDIYIAFVDVLVDQHSCAESISEFDCLWYDSPAVPTPSCSLSCPAW